MTDFLNTAAGRRIAYNRTAGRGPCVVFLGGFRSDMAGTKAVHLEAWARRQSRSFLRFDYSGHGESSGAFDQGAISDWAADATEVIERLTEGPVVLVGSSMGGWIALLVARRLDRVAGLVGIAAAPDFTEDSLWAGFDTAQRQTLMEMGRVDLPSEYGPSLTITRRMIEDGRECLVLRDPQPFTGPVRLLQGTNDSEVSRATALALLDHIDGDVRLTLVKGADHRFSAPDCLAMIERAIDEVTS